MSSEAQGLYQQAQDALLVVDAEGRVVEVNEQAGRLLAIAPAELAGRGATELVPALTQVALGQVPPSELTSVGPEGRRVPVELGLARMAGGRVAILLHPVSGRPRQPERVMLREIHHRVKNNLQLVSSLLKLHAAAARSDEARVAIDEAQQQVRAIARAYQSLEEQDERWQVSLPAYARALADAVAVGPVKVEVEEARLPLDQALPWGLVLTEVLRHVQLAARPAGAPASVTARRDGPALSLTVATAEVGDVPAVDGLGLRLASLMVKQLKGTLQLDHAVGLTARVRFEPGSGLFHG